MSARTHRTHRALTVLGGLAVAAALGACSVSASVSGSIDQSDLETQVASTMDDLTGNSFPVECDGDLKAKVDGTQRCWRILDGLADQGVPEGSRLGIDVVVTSVEDGHAKFDIQADDKITAPN
ncbi:hypothetical protein SAMN05216410_0877 [Sanguibacter gelidistatuariae]|uniref:DUF4333 domain-containing protein n=1 Tax=Sanguibacter gelidistatuariae TaxID=1814289 RepID=A0A1G6HAZ9_9MICO|nr:DUF4333 domain-containing protein [Sanguibacter gelidistatuariae]SDB91314.1 hypothetical protein SAMN05216410_0877 [Sanguibacter gelidistatuariae]